MIPLNKPTAIPSPVQVIANSTTRTAAPITIEDRLRCGLAGFAIAEVIS